jgi:dTDP-4-dehydrorhamnose 3,5-epimerase
VIFTPLALAGAYLIVFEPVPDHRGYYAPTWSARDFKAHGLNDRVVQCGASYNRKRGTLRGMHFQASPHAQAKLVRCGRGAIHDVIIDLRPDSASYCRWIAVDLSAARGEMVYIPEGFAHGFQTLEDHSEVIYQMSEYYHPEAERGVRWNDPRFAIRWPIAEVILSEKDRSYRDFEA